MKYLFALIISVIFTSMLFSQTHLFKSNGEVVNLKTNRYETKEELTEKTKGNLVQRTFDTLSYNRNKTFDVNFGFSSQDVLMQWFVAPADMIIKGIGFRAAGEDTNNSTVSIMLIKSNWDDDSLQNINVPKQMGYYASDGENNASYFYTETSGQWVDLTEGEYSLPPWSENYDDDVLWTSDQTMIPHAVEKEDLTYQFVETSAEGFEPEIEAGTILGIMLIHNGQNQGENRIDIWADQLDDVHFDFGIPGWKYYHAGNQAEPGWWAREYVFDFALAVDFPSGPRIFISNVTQITSTTSTDSMQVCCKITNDNPSGGPVGIEKAELIYSVNDNPEASIEMEQLGNYSYCAYIPGQEPGDTISYWVKASDINGYSTASVGHTYMIFKPNPDADLLVVMNRNSRTELLLPYYLKYYKDKYDTWNFEEIPAELPQHYSTIIEINVDDYSNQYDNRTVISNWLSEGNKNYLLADQEALGVWNNFNDSVFVPGDFEYEYLGVQESFNDVSYNPDNDSSIYQPSLVKFVGETTIGDAGADLQADYIWFHPNYILGSQNWLDQFIPREDIESEVFMTGYDWSITHERAVGHNFIDDKNNKIVFMSFDPLTLIADTTWIGEKEVSPFTQALYWLGITTDVTENADERYPTFHLSQNYPNPFNPSTTIKFNLPAVGTSHAATADGRDLSLHVNLIIYDILGREIKTLINKPMVPGSYEVDFDGTGLPSGVYFYRLTSGEFSKTRKMLLMK